LTFILIAVVKREELIQRVISSLLAMHKNYYITDNMTRDENATKNEKELLEA
jgi:hypothetical protein